MLRVACGRVFTCGDVELVETAVLIVWLRVAMICASSFMPFSRRHVSDILADEITGGKVLVFAHHRNVLDALENGVLTRGSIEFIRIDGRTKVSSCRYCACT